MLSYLFGHKFPSLKEQKVPKVEYDRVVAELQTAVNQMNDAIQIGMGHSSASAAFLWCQNHFKWAGGKATPERWNDHFVAFLSGYRETGLPCTSSQSTIRAYEAGVALRDTHADLLVEMLK